MGTKNIQNIRLLFVLCTCLFTACVKDKPTEPAATLPTTQPKDNVYVVCEGNFGNGDGSLYHYDADANTATGDLFAAANNGGQLGDVFQSMVKIGDKLFLCINNSDKIVVLNNDDKKQVGTIPIAKPRYILPVSATKAYVSSLFGNKLYIINPQTMQQTGSIDMPYLNPEGMALYNGKAYVCAWDTACRSIYSIDINTDKITAIPVGASAPQEVLVDKSNRLWVLSGNVPKGKPALLTVLDEQDRIVRSYNLPVKADVIKPTWNRTKDTLYFIEVNYSGGTDYNGVYRMGINDSNLPATAFVSAQSFQYFWALGIAPSTGKIYIGDPRGFIQKGSVAVYGADGNNTANFIVGVGPGHFYFD